MLAICTCVVIFCIIITNYTLSESYQTFGTYSWSCQKISNCSPQVLTAPSLKVELSFFLIVLLDWRVSNFIGTIFLAWIDLLYCFLGFTNLSHMIFLAYFVFFKIVNFRVETCLVFISDSLHFVAFCDSEWLHKLNLKYISQWDRFSIINYSFSWLTGVWQHEEKCVFIIFILVSWTPEMHSSVKIFTWTILWLAVYNCLLSGRFVLALRFYGVFYPAVVCSNAIRI